MIFSIKKSLKDNGLVKSRKSPSFVIPVKTGIQLFQDVLDPGFRRGDGRRTFYESVKDEAGFNLIEVLIAVTILSIGLLAVGSMQLTAIRGNAMGGNTSASLTLASEKMEQLLVRNFTHADLSDTQAGNNADLSSITTVDHEERINEEGQIALTGRYRRIWNVANSSAPMPTMKMLAVIVTWDNNKHRVTISSQRGQQ